MADSTYTLDEKLNKENDEDLVDTLILCPVSADSPYSVLAGHPQELDEFGQSFTDVIANRGFLVEIRRRWLF